MAHLEHTLPFDDQREVYGYGNQLLTLEKSYVDCMACYFRDQHENRCTFNLNLVEPRDLEFSKRHLHLRCKDRKLVFRKLKL